MNQLISIEPQCVHLWTITLSDYFSQLPYLLQLLSVDEKVRAAQFKFEIHRQRFTVARALLRTVLSHYRQIAPEALEFDYGHRGKPFLRNNLENLQFNLSHSDDMAVIGVIRNTDIGVDIEKIEPDLKEDVAKKFFSAQEYSVLMSLPVDKQIEGFYQIWSKKEALIKALGEGLYAPLDKFSVHPFVATEQIEINHDDKMVNYHIESFYAADDYVAAFAVDGAVLEVKKILFDQSFLVTEN